MLGDQDFASFVVAEYDETECSTTFLASGADWFEELTDEQAALQSLLVRPHDTNATCFPGSNENAIIGFQLATCCWAAGLGNTPRGQPTWSSHDLSLLRLDRLTPERCIAGEYPCNDAGFQNPYEGFCYDTSCKLTWAEVYVR